MEANEIERTYETLEPALRDTPLRRSAELSRALGVELWMKDETANRLRCFKGRGAATFVMRHLAELARGAVCASAGNFGWAMADTARRHGVPMTVFVAENANARKVACIAETGATVVSGGRDFDAAKLRAAEFAAAHGLRYVEDGNEDAIAIGAGTIALEAERQIAAFGEPAGTWLIPVGNGALASGMGAWLNARRNSSPLRVIGVVSSGATVMRDVFRDPDRDTSTATADTIADGISVRVPIRRAVDSLRSLLDDIVAVDDESLVKAMRLLFETTGIETEPSAVAGIAALLHSPGLAARCTVATVLTGANVTDMQRNRWFSHHTEIEGSRP